MYQINGDSCANRVYLQNGLTIVEVLVSISIVALLAVTGVPAASDLYLRQRITAEVNYLSSLIQLARVQAIEQQTSAILCPSQNFINCEPSDWQLPKMLFYDYNHNRLRDQNEPIVYAGERVNRLLLFKGPNKLIRFYEEGTVASTASFIICPKNQNPSFNRAIFISLQGRVRLSEDSNHDGIHERGSGARLECN